jgi:hypothetical protein
MKYFDFDGLEHKAENLEIFLLVGLVYIIILAASWVYNRLAS